MSELGYFYRYLNWSAMFHGQRSRMKAIKEVMSKNVVCLSPDSSLRDIAVKMKGLDCGSIPVCENDRLVGMVPDRWPRAARARRRRAT